MTTHIHVHMHDAGSFQESKHPRKPDGKFGSGGGGGRPPPSVSVRKPRRGADPRAVDRVIKLYNEEEGLQPEEFEEEVRGLVKKGANSRAVDRVIKAYYEEEGLDPEELVDMLHALKAK